MLTKCVELGGHTVGVSRAGKSRGATESIRARRIYCSSEQYVILCSVFGRCAETSEDRSMTNQKTSALIESCATTFKRTGLLRLAEEGPRSANSSRTLSIVPPGSSLDRTYSVPSEAAAPAHHGNLALDVDFQMAESEAVSPRGLAGDFEGAHARRVSETQAFETETRGRALGFRMVDEFLPDGGLPVGKVTELQMSGGAAWGTRVALWACRTAQAQAQLNGTDSWCAFIDPSGTLQAPGVSATGVALSRLLVLRPALEDVERVVLRLCEARVFSVIVVDLSGVPWAVDKSRRAGSASKRGRFSKETLGGNGAFGGSGQRKHQNWPRTVRQLAMRLANTSSQVILLTEGNADGQSEGMASGHLPLPVALRVQMRSERSGVSLRVVKESHGRVGAQVTVPWETWWGNATSTDLQTHGRTNSREVASAETLVQGRAKPLEVRTQRVQSLLRPVSAERRAKEEGFPIVASSRIARSSRASL